MVLSGVMGAVNLLSYYSDAEGVGDCVLCVFTAEEADGVGDKGSGNNTSIFVAGADVLGLLGHQHSHRRNSIANGDSKCIVL